MLQASLGCINAHKPFTVECDALDFAIAAVLNQNGKPVAFMSHTLTPCESRYPIIEKEAASIIEAVCKWSRCLYGRPFTLITDQRSLAFMFDQANRGKIKNPEIQAWRIELGMFSYKVIHRLGSENVAPDTLSRVCSVIGQPGNLRGLHESLDHPGVSRLWHFVRSKNLPFSIDEVQNVYLNCRTCSELKPRYQQSNTGQLIKATQTWEHIIVDFKGPQPRTVKGNKYLLVVVDEFSRFPFAFPCKDTTTASTVNTLFLVIQLNGFSIIRPQRQGNFIYQQRIQRLHAQ